MKTKVMRPPCEHTDDLTRQREKWVHAVRALCKAITRWSEARGWFVHEDTKTVSESRLGTYEVPTLFIQSPAGRIHIDPIGGDIFGSDGRVDIVAFPTLSQFLLVRVGEHWRIKTESGINWPKRWSERTFFELVATLTAP